MRTRAQAEPRDRALEIAAHLAVAGEHEPRVGALRGDARERLDQHELALLRAQPADADQLARVRRDRPRGREERLVDAAAHHADVRPVRGIGPAPQLRGGEVADAATKLRLRDLAASARPTGASARQGRARSR
jgi:hypothetical protein